MRKKEINMCHGPILPQMIRFGLPVLFTGVLQQLFNAADVILAGQLGTSGSDAVAAVGSTTALTSLMINFFIGCSTGSAVAVSRAVGSRDNQVIRQTIHTSMLLALAIGTFLTIVGITLSGTLLSLMDTPEEIIRLSTTYLQAYFCGMIPYMVYNFGASILRAMGQTQKPMYFLLISGPLKLIFTLLFVAGLHLDVAGLALATACSQLVSAVLVVISLTQRHDVFKLCLRELRFSREPLKKILRLGIPSGIGSTTFSLSSVFIQTSVNSLSSLPGFITGNAAACSIEAFANVFTSTFYTTSLNFTGQNAGAQQYDRVKRVYMTASALSCVVIGVVSALVCLFAKPLLELYITDSPEAIHWGTVRLHFIFAPLILQGLMDTTSGALRGLEISFSTMIICLFGVCGLRILWGLTIFQIPHFHTPQILFLCYPVSWIVTYLAELILYVLTIQRKSKTMQLKRRM